MPDRRDAQEGAQDQMFGSISLLMRAKSYMHTAAVAQDEGNRSTPM